MEISVYLARFWGSLFIILGLSSILAKLLGRIIKYTEDMTITVSTGYITFLLGLITVTLHNIWVADWRVAITILGWTTLLKGIEKIAFPGRVNKIAQMFKGRQQLWEFCDFSHRGVLFLDKSQPSINLLNCEQTNPEVCLLGEANFYGFSLA